MIPDIVHKHPASSPPKKNAAYNYRSLGAQGTQRHCQFYKNKKGRRIFSYDLIALDIFVYTVIKKNCQYNLNKFLLKITLRLPEVQQDKKELHIHFPARCADFV